MLVRYLGQTDACETAHVRHHAPHDDTIDGTLYVARLDELTAAIPTACIRCDRVANADVIGCIECDPRCAD